MKRGDKQIVVLKTHITPTFDVRGHIKMKQAFRLGDATALGNAVTFWIASITVDIDWCVYQGTVLANNWQTDEAWMQETVKRYGNKIGRDEALLLAEGILDIDMLTELRYRY
jgi:hypothetical protein